MALNYETTWIGIMGGGVSGSIIGGGSVYQIDLWNMGGKALPARVLVTGKRVGLVAELGTAHAMLLVTGCRTAEEMDGITSSGIDWEFSVGVKGSALVKTGSKLFKIAATKAASEITNWAVQESAKRLAQWVMDDLGVVKPGKQFNLLPSPLSFGVGAGLFYDWQTLNLLQGNIGWDKISPSWFVDTSGGEVRLKLDNIPEQDGTQVLVGIGVDEWGADPLIRWKRVRGNVKIDSAHKYQIVGYCHRGQLFSTRDGSGSPGINFAELAPIGEMVAGWASVKKNNEVKKDGTLKVYPEVFKFSNYACWSADDTVDVMLDSKGCFVGAKNAGIRRS